MRKRLPAGLLLTAALLAHASENYDLRYAPGIGGADMSAPFEGGWVIQAPAYRYHGTIDHQARQIQDLSSRGLPAGVNADIRSDSRITIDVAGVLGRVSYMSNHKVLGAQLGVTALLPVLSKKTAVKVLGVNSSINAPGLDSLNQAIRAGATVSANRIAAANSNSRFGLGDLEIAPMLRWASDNSQWLLVPAIILPTGSYDADKAANPGSGKFYTFRPLVQYSYIGEGWDLGIRGSLAINSENKDTHFRTGNYLNADFALMKSVSDAWRLGVAGYLVAQTTADSRSQTSTDEALLARQALTLGSKGHVYGLGLQFAYLQGGGDYLIDGRIVREFGAEDRPQGTTVLLNASLPF
ncbi:transporter [Chitinimonas sp.]|uniref:SphA family protein n=1 Tax=Chitinimonas sp. TaxID=1934313 RepID=UPI0035B29AEF